MPAKKQWDEEESDSSTPPSSPPVTAARRRQFGDEEDDSDVLESWDAAEDSEVEREKERKATEAKAKVAAEAAANKKSKAERIASHQAERARQRAEDEEESEDDETEAERRERIRRTEQEADLKHAEDLFGTVGLNSGRKAPTIGAAVVVDSKDPTNTVNLNALPLFNPQTKKQFEQMRTTLAPIISGNGKKAHYGLFLEEFVRELAKEMNSDQVKKVASALTRLSNEKMKEEKAAEKGGKKSKAAKTKTSLVTSRPNTTDTATYDDDAFGEYVEPSSRVLAVLLLTVSCSDDFM
ncbi:hypothetical protein PCL_02965 [Purpureocillium lilacinum]|uniref:Eukaryotic translation initiation factor 3 subunit J n=1 Tax=Purpureocillium lilacinum TaxID=33203 RepID=A0A2U3DZB7_PURLI|nr:hypothetical protein PCL_02965 [Purpureocillium lilacinum]